MIFIDTEAIVGRLVARDQCHRAATLFWNELAFADVQCITTNLVRELYNSHILHILRPTHANEIDALNLFEKFSDQRVSFVDCIPFVLMRRHKVQEAFGFDQHFISAGFT